MPGPKMGPRPPDFNEASLKQSPTYIKWSLLQDGEKLRYACREFIKGHEQDDERLLRRIMIARRNNIRDHETLKVARQRVSVDILNTATGTMIPRSASEKKAMKAVAASASEASTNSDIHEKVEPIDTSDLMEMDDTTDTHNIESMPVSTVVALPQVDAIATISNNTTTRARRPPQTFSDEQIHDEMDVAAVIKTRSYRSWLEVPDGGEFVVRTTKSGFVGILLCYFPSLTVERKMMNVILLSYLVYARKQYNQKYIKGRDGQDWLLRKNIWRRMRYRRENKQLVLLHHRHEKRDTVDGNRNDRYDDGNNVVLHATTNTSLQPRQLRSSPSTTNGTGPIAIKHDTSNHVTAGASLGMGEDMIHDDDTAQMDIASTAAAAVNHNNTNEENTNDTNTASAAAAAVAAVAASLADEAAVEAAVAAAESHFHLQQQQQEEQEARVGIDMSESDVVSAAATAAANTALDEATIAAAVAVAAAVVASSSSNATNTNTNMDGNIDLIVDENDIDDQGVAV